MHVSEIKINFLFSLCYHEFTKLKKLLRKNITFSHFFIFFAIFCRFWTLISWSFFVRFCWNLVCWFVSLHSIFSILNMIINYPKQKSYSRKTDFLAFSSFLRGRNPPFVQFFLWGLICSQPRMAQWTKWHGRKSNDGGGQNITTLVPEYYT